MKTGPVGTVSCLSLSMFFGVFLAATAYSAEPMTVVPLLKGSEHSIPALDRTTDTLEGKREKIWEFYPESSSSPDLEGRWWRPHTSPELHGKVLCFISFGGGRDRDTGKLQEEYVFHALDFETGDPLWSTPFKRHEVIARIHRGVVYLTLPNIFDREEHVLSAHDLATGTRLWSAPDSGYVLTMALGEQLIVNTYYPGYLHKEHFLAALNRRTAKELWRRPMMVKGAKTHKGRLFVLGGSPRGDAIYSLDPAAGSEHWRVNLTRDNVWGVDTRSAGHSYSKSEPNWAVDSDRIYVVIDEKGDRGKSPLVAIDQETGAILWEKAYHKEVRSLVRSGNGKAYIVYGWNFSFGGFPGGDGPWANYWMEKLYAADGATGRVLWDFGRAVDDFFLVSDGRVFLLNNTDGRLFRDSSYYLLDAESGRKLAEYEGYESFAGMTDDVELAGGNPFPALPDRWILRGPDGALWHLSYFPMPGRDNVNNHALLMESLKQPALP